MPWFRLEDSFFANAKVLAAGNAATGLWVRCASWSAQQLTDGVIPHHVVNGFGTKREIDACTAARLWVPVNDDYCIPDWLEYQMSADEIKEKRRRDADRKRDGRARGAGRAVDLGLVGRDDHGRFTP